MSASIKIRQLESKISELQSQYQLLLKERQQEIAALLTVVDLAHIDDKTLVGGLLFLKEKISSQDSAALSLWEGWHNASENFLRRHKPKFSTRQQLHEERKSGGNFSPASRQASK